MPLKPVQFASLAAIGLLIAFPKMNHVSRLALLIGLGGYVLESNP